MKRLIFFTLLVISTGCSKEQQKWKTQTVKKGNHYTGQPVLKTIKNSDNFSVLFKLFFTESCSYDSTVGDHWNKVGGLYFPTRKNSLRFGWRSTKDSISICAYAYEDGKQLKQYWKPLIKIPLCKTKELFMYKVGNTLSVLESGKEIFRHSWREGFLNTSYVKVANLYFGGTPTAPHKVKVKVAWEINKH